MSGIETASTESADEGGWLLPPTPSPAVAARLQHLALARTEIFLPIVLIGMVFALVISEPSGVPVTWPIFATNVGVLVAGTWLYVALRRKRLPVTQAHAVSALIWLMPPVNTLTSLFITDVPTLTLMLMIELASIPILIDTRWALAASVPIVVTSLPLMLRAHTSGVFMTAVVGVWVVGVLMHLVLRRATIKGETHRNHLMSALESLEIELAERKRAEADREQLRDQFVHAQRMEAVGTLSAGLAHDMNNILGGILAFAQILRSEAKDKQVQQDLDRIKQEAERGAALTRGLLAFSRRGAYRRRPLPLASVLDDMTPLLQTLGKGITIERVDGPMAIVDGDPAQLGQVLFNLCRNAADAMGGEGTIMIKTAIVERSAVTHAKLSVTDTGTGMDEATQKRMFEPFFTTKPIGKGTGLGLAMVYGAIEAHGGTVEVRSAPEEGTTVNVFIPTTEELPQLAHRAAGQPSVRRGHVLVVDDDQTIREALSRITEGIGLTPLLAANGREALALWENNKGVITLVLLDMVMPELDGPATFRALREQSNVPVLLVSGYTDHTAAQQLLSEGAEGFLEKPYTAEQLGAEIDRILGRRSSENVS
jgi:signal transduction histidine kinase/CheY-like chemotaxis protein